MPQPDPAWVTVGRAIYELLVDSGLSEDDQIVALDFARTLTYHPATPKPPRLLNVDARNPDAISVLNPYGAARPRP